MLAALGVALVAAAVALALAREPERDAELRAPVQVGGRRPEDFIRAASTPVLAVDPANPRRMLLANRIEKPRFSCSVFASEDGGETWKASRFSLPAAGDRCYAPYVLHGAGGRSFLLLTMLEGRGNEPWGGFLYASRDGGATFGPPRQVLPRFTFQASLARGSGNSLYLSSLDGTEFSRHATFGLGPPPNPVAVRISRDGGSSFRERYEVSSRARQLVGGPALALGPNGEIYVLYWDYGDDVFDYYAFPGRYGGRFQLVLSVSRDGGRTFREHVVEPNVVPAGPFLVYLPPLPALAVDRRSGAVYAAWEDGRSGASDVLFRRSLDGGRSWSDASVLFGGGTDDRTPALSVSSQGRLVAIAYRLAARGRAEVAVRASDDAGRTFSAPAALTPTPFDAGIAPRVANRSDEIDLGSRLALGEARGATFAAWADTRAGTPDTGKVDILLRPVPRELPEAGRLERASGASPAGPSAIDRRLGGRCTRGPRVASRASPLAVIRSFLSALGAGELRRAYGYLDPRWRDGRAPLRAPHPFREFAKRYGELSCVRLALAESYDRSEDGQWNTFRVWAAARRSAGPNRVMFGLFWTHSDTGRAPWSLIGFWTRELGSR